MPTELSALGELISWRPPSKVALDDVRNALTAAQLDEKLARDMVPRNAFARAAQEMKEDRIIEIVHETADDLVFQFTKKFLTGAGGMKEMSYTKECHLILNKRTGLISCNDPQIEQLAQQQLVAAMETRKANDITRIVQAVFEKHEADLIAVREQGGVYFVPEHLEELVDKVDQFLSVVGGNLRRFRIAPDGGSTDASVASSINDHFRGMLDQLNSQVVDITSETSDSVKARRTESFALLRGKLETYRDLLRGFAGDIETGIDGVEKLFLQRINAIPDTAPGETPDEPEAAEATPAPVNFADAFERLKRSMASAPAR